MELIKGGSLTDLIKLRASGNRGFSDEEASIIMKGIFGAVHHLHEKDIVHRDLKPGNEVYRSALNLTR